MLTVDDNPQVVRVIEHDLKQQYGKRYMFLTISLAAIITPSLNIKGNRINL